MHPAPSVIVFTVLSGAGFGLLAFLGFGVAPVVGLSAFLLWGLGYGLAVIGLLASTFHLGNPQRALRAFTQWKTSWLSREAWASVAALMTLAPVALASILGVALPGLIGFVGGLFCLATIFATSMIYTQLRTIPRWNYWTTPVLFMAFALSAGAILTGKVILAAVLCIALGALLVTAFRLGDDRFAEVGATIGSATGLGSLGAVRQLAPPHTTSNYLLREMIHVVGRKHANRLRKIAVAAASVVPALVLLVLPSGVLTVALVAVVHLAGAFAARWLFFAEAEHVVGLYYDQR